MKKVENDEQIVGEYDKLWVKKVNKLKNVHKYYIHKLPQIKVIGLYVDSFCKLHIYIRNLITGYKI